MTQFTNDSISADSFGAVSHSYLLTVGADSKTVKGEKLGFLTGVLYLSPARIAGFEVCANRTLGCTAACLNTAGRGAFQATVHTARLSRTLAFRRNRNAFMRNLEREIASVIRRAKRRGLIPVIRLNGTSDLPWESISYVREDGTRVACIMDVFPDVQFYDYTKGAYRFARELPRNYDLTFSLADGNDSDAATVLANGGRVAAVFGNSARPMVRKWTLPKRYNGRRVVDADTSDLRFLDPRGVYCGLRAKGSARQDDTGFVKWV